MNTAIAPDILVGFSAQARTLFHGATPPRFPGTSLAWTVAGECFWADRWHVYPYAGLQRLQAQDAKLAALRPCPRCFKSL